MTRLVHPLLAALLLCSGALSASGEEARTATLIPCLEQDDCPPPLRCNWGLCEQGLLGPGELFQWSVLDIPDLTAAPGSFWLRDHLANRLVESLESTGIFRAIRHGGAFPVDTGTLFSALRNGSAYVVAAHLADFDGLEAALNLEVIDTETGERVIALCDQLVFRVGTGERAIEEWVNRTVRHFTGRPGILGARLACVRKLEQGVKEVFLLTYGTGELEQVTRDHSLALLPSWTVDGRVAYTSYKQGRPKIFVGDGEEAFVAFEGMNSGITWTRDGAIAAVTLSKDENSEIYVLEGTTGEVRARLTYHPGIDTSPTWSPDGSRIAFVTDRDGTPQLYSMLSSGADKQRLTFSGTYNTSPDWHPFGPHLVYAARVAGEFQVFRFDLEDGSQRQLTFGPGDAEAPAWSPDGRLVAFVWRKGAEQNIYVMNPDGSSIRAVTHDDGPYYAPVWQPVGPGP